MNAEAIRQEIDQTKTRIASEVSVLRARQAQAGQLAAAAAVVAAAAVTVIALAVHAIRHYRRRHAFSRNAD
jgi:hypothetical protein